MKMPNPIKSPFGSGGGYISPWCMSHDIKKLKRFHDWLGRMIAWCEKEYAKEPPEYDAPKDTRRIM